MDLEHQVSVPPLWAARPGPWMKARADVETVAAWHAALNHGDVERVLSLSAEDVQVGGPRGVASGANLLRDWISRTGIHLEPREMYGRDGTVVVAQLGRWQGADGSLGEPQAVASVFRVRDGLVVSVVRHDDVGAALEAAGLEESDLV